MANELYEEYPHYDVLNDFSKADYQFNVNDFKGLMEHFSKTNFPTKPKIFIMTNPKHFVIYNFYKDNYSFNNTQIFNTMEAACYANGINLIPVKDFFE